MKRKIATTLTAVTVCTAMLGSTVLASSFDGNLDETKMGGQEITGDSGVENPTYKIVVPTTLDFAVDPFQQKGQSQIYSKDFYMVNKSNVPVQLDCAVTLTAGTDVVLKNTEAEVTETNSDKLIYMEAEIPGAVTETTKAAAAFSTALKKDGNDYYEATNAPSSATDADEMIDTTDAKGTYTTSKKVGLGTTEKKLSFALKEATYQEYYTADDQSASAKQFKQVADTQAGSAAFRFGGKVNTKATWAENAVTAKVKYTFNGLTPTNYTGLIANPDATAHAYVAGSQNVLTSDGTNDVVIYYSGSQPTTITITPINTPGTSKDPLQLAASTTSIFDVTDEVVKIKASWIASIKPNAKFGAGTYKVSFNGEDYTMTVN